MGSLPTGTVTFLFTDIEGSTRLLSALGADYDAELAKHREIIRTAVAAHGGVEVSTEGDAIFAVFPGAVEALVATAGGQRALADQQWRQPLLVRMGLHTGQARVSGRDYIGMDVHRAARIAAAAHGGQVLLSDATGLLVERALPTGLACVTSVGTASRTSRSPSTFTSSSSPIDRTTTARPDRSRRQRTSPSR